MKKIIILISALALSTMIYADAVKLSDGNVIMWQNETSRILYESYRVEIQLYTTSNFNVCGTVTLGNQTKNFIIYAGEKKTYVDFENLDNGKFYQVYVNILNKEAIKYPQR